MSENEGSTPAAPGIDPTGLRLTAKRLADLIRNYRDHPKMTDFWRPAWAAVLRRTEELADMIDASPKGGINSRATFEAWAAGKILPLHRMQIHIGIMGDYSDAWTHCAWTAWQAAMQATSAEVGG